MKFYKLDFNIFVLIVLFGSGFFDCKIFARGKSKVPREFQEKISRALPQPCPLAEAASFCNVNMGNLCVTGNAQINGSLFVNGSISASGSGFGNVCRVDSVYGDNITASRNGPPFRTIQAALNASEVADVIWIFPGIYEEIINIPPGRIVSSISPGSVTIQQMNVTTPTDLVTIGDGSYLRNVSLLMTSAEHVQMRGVFHNGMSIPSATTVIDDCAIFIFNPTAGAGSSDIYGIYMTGVGTVGFIGDFILNGIVEIISTGGGKKRGIYIDSPTLLELFTPLVFMSGGTDVIAFEANNPGVVVASQAGAFNGDFIIGSPDISQTQGSIQLDSTYLGNSNANGSGFIDLTFPNTFIWGDPNYPIGAGEILFMRPGTAEASVVPINLLAFQKFLARELSVRCVSGPGPGESTTWTLLKNGIATPLALTLTGNSISGEIEGISVHFSEGDNIAMQIATSNNTPPGASTSDVLVELAVY